MVNLIDLLAQKIEIFQLERRYTRGRNRRSTFVSEAQYVNGEYVYSPTSSYSAKCSAGSSDEEVDGREFEQREKEVKGSKRMSRLGLDRMDWRKGVEREKEKGSQRRTRADKRKSRISISEMKWEAGR